MVKVIDHHRLDRTPSSSCRVTVEPVGSCATLVTERIVQKAPELLDQQVAQLLYGKYSYSQWHIFLPKRHHSQISFKKTNNSDNLSGEMLLVFRLLPARGRNSELGPGFTPEKQQRKKKAF